MQVRERPWTYHYRVGQLSDASVISRARRSDTEEGMAWCQTTPLTDAPGGKGTSQASVPDLCSREAENPFHRLMHWVAEARSHRVICLVLGIWLLNGFDLAFTILSYEQGVLHEENPVARHMLEQGTASMILFKIGLVLIGSYPLLRFRRARITELGSYVILAAYAFLAFRWSTCFELYADTVGHDFNLAGIESLIKTPPQ